MSLFHALLVWILERERKHWILFHTDIYEKADSAPGNDNSRDRMRKHIFSCAIHRIIGFVSTAKCVIKTSQCSKDGNEWNSNHYSVLGLIRLLVNSMEQSPFWKANSFSASQEIHRILWNPKFRFHIYKRLLRIDILSQINPVHACLSHFRIFVLS